MHLPPGGAVSRLMSGRGGMRTDFNFLQIYKFKRYVGAKRELSENHGGVKLQRV